MNQRMGTGYLGETKMGPDGNLYQWVEGIDGLGNPVGFWSRLKKLGKRALRTAAQYYPPAQALKLVSRSLSEDGLGALYQAPDGSLYQMQGLGVDEEGLGADDLTQMLGLGSYVGETRMAPDGNVYQWVQGVDGLGNSFGFWKRLRRLAKGLVRKAVPIIKQVAPLVPGGAVVASALQTATPFLKRVGVAGNAGLGALYQAPDGTLYQMQGFAEDDMAGLADDELQGFADDEMAGLADDELQGFADDEMGELAEDDLNGLADDEPLQGYVRQDGLNGLAAYVPQKPPSTPWFQAPAQAPKIWESPW